MPNLSLNPFPLGKIAPVSGTPIPLTNNFPAFSGNKLNFDDLYAMRLQFIADLSNTGKVYIGLQTMNRATLQGVLYIIRPGETRDLMSPSDNNTYHVGEFFVDVDTTGDYILCGAEVA